MACISGEVQAELRLKKMEEMASRRAPAASSASTVLAKVGGSALHIGLGFTDGGVEGGFVMFEADGFEGRHLEWGGERRQ